MSSCPTAVNEDVVGCREWLGQLRELWTCRSWWGGAFVGWQWRVRVGDREDASEEPTGWIRLDARLTEYLFPCGGGWGVIEADGRVGWLGHLGRRWGPVVCVSRDWVKMGVLGDVLGVPLSGELHRWSGLGVVGALVSGARTVLGG